MSARAIVALHLAWMVIIVSLALWVGWLFRFEGNRDFYYLDRWTGELVENTGHAHYRYSLRRAAQKEFLVERVTADPAGILTESHAAPAAPGAFDDLIPKK